MILSLINKTLYYLVFFMLLFITQNSKINDSIGMFSNYFYALLCKNTTFFLCFAIILNKTPTILTLSTDNLSLLAFVYPFGL